MARPVRIVETIEDLEIEVRRLLTILEAHLDEKDYPRSVDGDVLTFDRWRAVTFDAPLGDATPFVERRDRHFDFVVSERGYEIERWSGDADAVLERIFVGLTSALAGQYEVRTRSAGQDPRRIMFARQIELLKILNAGWSERESNRHQTVLADHPLEDGPPSSIASPE